jgi:CHAT domain-containing protein
VLADPVFDPGDPRVTRARRPGGSEPGSRPNGVLALTRAAESVGRASFSRLPFSRQEAGSIAALAAPGSLAEAMDFEASRSWIDSGGLAGRSIVHFATHGLLNGEHPDLSGLVLSLVNEKAAWQDGFLRMTDIYNLRLDAELVVLSACQTALGRDVRGEGLIGVTRGFMYAGAPRVVASLWQVDDQSTAELMRLFYRGLLRERHHAAEALRLAQLELARQKRWAAPYYWAGFIMQGEWN